MKNFRSLAKRFKVGDKVKIRAEGFENLTGKICLLGEFRHNISLDNCVRPNNVCVLARELEKL